MTYQTSRRDFLRSLGGVAVAARSIDSLVAQSPTSETVIDEALLHSFRNYVQRTWNNPSNRRQPLIIWQGYTVKQLRPISVTNKDGKIVYSMHEYTGNPTYPTEGKVDKIVEVKVLKYDAKNTKNDMLIMHVFDGQQPGRDRIISMPYPKDENSFLAYQDRGIHGIISNILDAREPKNPIWTYKDLDEYERPAGYYNALLRNTPQNEQYQILFKLVLEDMVKKRKIKS